MNNMLVCSTDIFFDIVIDKFHCAPFTRALDACCNLFRQYQPAYTVACYTGTAVRLHVSYCVCNAVYTTSVYELNNICNGIEFIPFCLKSIRTQ